MGEMLDDIASYLVAATTTPELVLSTNLYLGLMRDGVNDPDECVALHEQPGRPPEETFGAATTPVFERPTLIVHTRAGEEDYGTSRSIAHQVRTILCKIANQTINGTYYVRVASIDSPAPIDRDEKKRVIFQCTFAVERYWT